MVTKSRRTASRRAANRKKKATLSERLTGLSNKTQSVTSRTKKRREKAIDECFTKACNNYVNRTCRNAVKDLDILLEEAAKEGKEHFPLYTTWTKTESYATEYGGSTRIVGTSDSNVIYAIENSLRASLDRENISYDTFDIHQCSGNIDVWSIEDRIRTRLKKNLKRRGLTYATVSISSSTTAFSVVWGKLEKKANKNSDRYGYISLHG